MTLKNLGGAAKVVEDIWGKTLKESGQDNYRKNVLNKYVPQVFAQDLKELKAEIKNLSRGVKKGEAGSFTNSGATTDITGLDVPPVITLSEVKCVEIYTTIFNKEKQNQKDTWFTEKVSKSGKVSQTLGTDGIVLDNFLYNKLIKDAKKLLGAGEWLIAPVKNLDTAQRNINSRYSKKLAAAEMANRKGTSRKPKKGREQIEENYVAYRLSGFQSSKVAYGSQEKYRDEGLTQYEKSTGLQLGHADAGSSTYEHKLAHAERLVKDAKDFEGKEDLLTSIQKIKEQYSVKIQHEEHIDLKKFKKGYAFIVVTGQRTSLNMKQNKEAEQKLGSEIHNKIKKLLLVPHDTILTKTIGGLLINKLTKGSRGVKNTSKRYISKKAFRSKEEKKGKKKQVQRKYTCQVGTGGLTFATVGESVKKENKKAVKRAKITARPSISNTGSPLQVLAIFNAKLEQKIIDNMGGAALHNRTGRFAESVKVLNIMPVKGTHGTIQYNYMRDPYGVFERDGARDPRLLIDKTLREQAAEMALGKFTTQRV